MKKIFLIDGNSLLFRAYYSTSPLSNKDNFPTNAIYGYSNMLLRILSQQPDYIIAAFDTHKPTFRHLMYKEYKAQRKPIDEELIMQMEPARALTEAFGVTVLEMEGYEADDIIGTIAKKSSEKDINVCIWTGDLDGLQLVDRNISLYHTVRGVSEIKIYDENAVKERYDVTPSQFVDFKGLKGDSSDNIPGVPGIGDKTAAKLISEYGSIQGIYENISTMKESKVKKNLTENKEEAFLSKKLAQIDINVPVEFDFDRWEWKDFNHNELYKLFKLYQFRGLMQHIDKSRTEKNKKSEKIKNPETVIIENEKALEELLRKLENEPEISFYFDYVPQTDRFVSCSVYTEKYGLFSITMECEESLFDTIIFDEEFHLKPENIKNILENENIKKIFWNSKALLKIFRKKNINIKNIYFDTYLAAYAKDSGKSFSSLKELADTLFDRELPENAFANYICYKKLYDDLKENNSLSLLFDIEQPLSYILADMELAGVEVNKKKLRELSEQLETQLKEKEKNIYNYAGHEFNILSPKQLSDVLFEELNIPYPKKSKKFSTNAEILEQLKEYPIISLVLEYRELSKIKSTYADALVRQISLADGRVHTTFNQTGTSTGRLSSENPNIQNIPNRQGIGMKIREAFVSAKEYSLISCDYSQIEFRIFAHITGDTELIRAFESGADFHTATAMKIFDLPEKEITKDMRNKAKTMNFAILYGMGAYSLSAQLGTGVKEAGDFINSYFERFPEILKTKNSILANARENGFVSTIFNRRLYVGDLSGGNFYARQQSERAAVNMPFQGSAADIMKTAMINISKRIEKEGKDIKILLQVHDEIVCECPDTILTESAKLIKEEMENAYKLKVPLIAECKAGKNWAEMNKI